jgi:DNA-binding winged helix-turn-helix (wHTH) protein
MRVRFGEFTFDSERRELRAGSELVHLTPKAFELLLVLLSARPRAVSKEELQEQLWPETFVSDTNLKMLASTLRSALGDDARDPTWIRTVYGFGYAFPSADVVDLPTLNESESGGVIFRLRIGERTVLLDSGANLMGREADAAVVIDSDTVSRHHAVILVRNDGASIEDLQSKNGTFVGGRRVDTPVELADGDEIRLGSVRIGFSAIPRAGSTTTHTIG